VSPLLSKKEAAEVLGVGLRRVEALISTGELAHVRPSPRRVLIDPRDIEKFVAANRLPRGEWRR
jgi:excisionase family DNA binding protein